MLELKFHQFSHRSALAGQKAEMSEIGVEHIEKSRHMDERMDGRTDGRTMSMVANSRRHRGR